MASPWIPQALVPHLRRLSRRGLRFDDSYASFAEAAAAALGYEDAKIADRVVTATRAVVDGKAPAERDGILLEQVEHPWFVIAGLAGATTSQGLSIADFGGSLGTTFRAVSPILPQIYRWTIIEQPSLLAAAAEFAGKTLRFAADLTTVSEPIDAVLFSSVLQYIDDPFQVCRQAIATAARRIVIDRTPFSLAGTHRYAVQSLPARFYSASYPSHIFADQAIAQLFPGWKILASRVCDEGRHHAPGGLFEFRGYILERREP